MENKKQMAQIKAGAKQAIDETDVFLVVTPDSIGLAGGKAEVMALLTEAVKRSSPKLGIDKFDLCDAIKFLLKEIDK